MTTDNFDRGLVNRRAVLGDEWVDRALGRANELNADFQSLITQYAWHAVWGRPGLDKQTRRLLVLGMTMGLARWEEFELHCRAALRAGVPLAAIRETLMQGAIYCGVPAANTAFKIASELCAAEGIELAPAPLTPAARVVRHHTFSAPQLQVAVQDAAPGLLGGQGGVPVVLSHALGLDHTMWDSLAATLSAGRPVLRYDHRGHGASAVPAGPYRMDDLVDDAARLIHEWGRGPVVFIGLSMGGMVAQGLAVRYPQLVRGIVAANTTARYPEAGRAVFAQRIRTVGEQGLGAIADSVMERYLHADFRAANADVEADLRAQLLRCNPAGYAACCAAVAEVDWLERLPAVTCPALVLAGARDVGAPPAMAEAMAQAIPGATLTVFDDASHLSVVEQPQAFAEAVQVFLAGFYQA